MTKNRFLIHGYAGKELSFWLKWLEEQLNKDAKVFFPSYEKSKTPVMNEWTNLFENKLKEPTDQCDFIAHSIGCLVTMKLIEQNDVNVQEMVLVACPKNEIGAHTQIMQKMNETEQQIFTDFVEHEYNWELLQSKVKNSTFFFSDDDFAIPYEETISYYQERFPRATFKTFNNYGHFNRKNDVYELPEVLNVIYGTNKG